MIPLGALKHALLQLYSADLVKLSYAVMVLGVVNIVEHDKDYKI